MKQVTNVIWMEDGQFSHEVRFHLGFDQLYVGQHIYAYSYHGTFECIVKKQGDEFYLKPLNGIG